MRDILETKRRFKAKKLMLVLVGGLKQKTEITEIVDFFSKMSKN